jgi:hypothetical protein
VIFYTSLEHTTTKKILWKIRIVIFSEKREETMIINIVSSIEYRLSDSLGGNFIVQPVIHD